MQKQYPKGSPSRFTFKTLSLYLDLYLVTSFTPCHQALIGGGLIQGWRNMTEYIYQWRVRGVITSYDKKGLIQLCVCVQLACSRGGTGGLSVSERVFRVYLLWPLAGKLAGCRETMMAVPRLSQNTAFKGVFTPQARLLWSDQSVNWEDFGAPPPLELGLTSRRQTNVDQQNQPTVRSVACLSVTSQIMWLLQPEKGEIFMEQPNFLCFCLFFFYTHWKWPKSPKMLTVLRVMTRQLCSFQSVQV